MWYQLQIEHCAHTQLDDLSEALEERGALSVMLTDKNDDPVLEPAPGTTPLWPEVVINALFAEANDAENCRTQLSAAYPQLQYSIEVLPDQNWERVWMDEFKPQRFGERLWICPSWITPPEPEAVNLILDPGLAFGTGTHPTTSLCLTWLEQAKLKGQTVIDYGCGSGILALAALKLGVKEVYAVDIDQQALQATQNNARENQIPETQLFISTPESLSHPVDLLIANILLAPLTSLRDRFQQLLKPKGTLVVSGLLEEQVGALRESYQDHFDCQSTKTMEGWGLVVFTRKD